MYCTKCGSPGQDDDAFCATCGSPLRGSSSREGAPAPVSPAERPAYAPVNNAPAPYWQANQVSAYQELAAPRRSASFGLRFGGYVIDGIINFVAGFLVSLALYAILLPSNYTQEDMDSAQVVVTLTLVAANFVYKWLMDSYGGTLGKRIVGLYVVDDTSLEPPGPGSGFLRTLVSIGSGIALGLGYLWAAWDREGKTWHDHAAHTIVVKRRDVA